MNTPPYISSEKKIERPISLTDITVNEAKTEIEILNCYPLLKTLRPNLKYVEEFLTRVSRQQANGYRLVYIQESTPENVISVIGFSIRERLLSGRTVHIEDFQSITPNVHQDLGPILLNWVLDDAKHRNCDNLVCDSSFTRHEAHRFYINNGFKITAHHFTRCLIAKRMSVPNFTTASISEAISEMKINSNEQKNNQITTTK